MKKCKQINHVQDGKYVAEVDVELMVTDDEWAPYLYLQNAYKLDDIHEALRRGDLNATLKKARVFTLQPIAT
ncbi:MAG: hypothetical protein GY807_02385 [Gammaproteobacteria bacterium]|nr:hypothetical protein [Gammaproteobacteria bacterium]